MRDLNGKTALVTGGGRGLGEAVCNALAEAGARVVVADVRPEAAAEVAGKLFERGLPLTLDVSDRAQVQSAIAGIAEKFGALDFLINNAAIDHTVPLEELDVEQWDRIIAVNLRGPFLMTKFTLPLMKKQGRGHIVNISSTAAKRTWANAAAYHASKWGLLGFSHAMHAEARQFGVKLTAVVSGGMRTPFLLERFPDIDLGCLQDPRNVAETVRFVLSQPAETVIPEVMVIPMRETSWP